jgi:hypothetical protein
MVAMAVLDQVLQGVAQLAEFADLLVQLVDVLPRQGFHIGAGALAILPQGQQLADFFQGKSQVPRALDERQRVQVVVAVDR